MSIRHCLSSLVFSLAFFHIGVTSAATWYVDGSVSAPGDGKSWETAFKGIQEGIDAASSGDVVIVAQETYFENIRFEGKNIVLRSTDPINPEVVANTIIDGNQTGSVVTFAGTEDETCVLSGFTIRNGNADYGGGICGGTRSDRTGATIQNNTVCDNVGRDSGGGLAYCDGAIRNNRIRRNLGTALYYCDGLILNNLIAENSGGGLSRSHGTIQNDTIVGNVGSGLWRCQGTIRNCIIWGNAEGGSGVQVRESTTPTYSCTMERIEAEGNISEDPRFVDTAGGDYHLHGESPCVNAGADYYWFSWPERDLDGNCRLAGGSVDMGCYEWGSAPDSDGDLLSDEEEWAAGTSPKHRDMDGDGLQDGIEMLRGSDPLTVTPPRVIHVPFDVLAIQEALCLAADGDEIIVAAGIYGGNLQFCGRDVILRSTDPEGHGTVASTILDAWRMGPVILFAGDESESCVLAGFTIRNGYAYYGAGICGGTRGRGTHATIRNNTIRDNTTAWEGDGGGLAFCHGTIRDNTIAGNTADGGGGLFQCNGVIDSNTISGNLGVRGGGGLSYCQAAIQNNTITYNWTYGYGGAIGHCDGKIRNNMIRENSALNREPHDWASGGGLSHCDGMIEGNDIRRNSTDGNGGGLLACGGTIHNNAIRLNLARGGGGALARCDGTIRNNIVSGNSAAGGGGGLSECYGAIGNNEIKGNTAGSGGGLFRCGGPILGNTISANRAEHNGGGLAFCWVLIRDNIIEGNSAECGGGLYSCEIVERNTICRNTATYGGGVAYSRCPLPYQAGGEGMAAGADAALGCTPLVRDNVITDNSADEGGGLYMCAEKILSNVISGNSATANGGGLGYCEGMIQGNTIRENTAGLHGGGLSGCRGSIQSNLICGNRAEGVGGGLYDCDNSINNTIVGNSANTAGGGLCDCQEMIVNCIVWGNTAAADPQLYDTSEPTYSCIQGWPEGIGEGNIVAAPLFVDLNGPDGDPQTFEDNDYRLQQDSPCIDSGSNAALEAWGVDAQGNLRLAFGRTSLTVDIGSYEYNAPRFGVTGILFDQAGNLQLSWYGQPGDRYIVQSSTDLLGYWHREASITSEGEFTSWFDPDPSAIRKFYRIEIY